MKYRTFYLYDRQSGELVCLAEAHDAAAAKLKAPREWRGKFKQLYATDQSLRDMPLDERLAIMDALQRYGRDKDATGSVVKQMKQRKQQKINESFIDQLLADVKPKKSYRDLIKDIDKESE